MLDQKNIIKVKSNDRTITLKADFRAFKKLHELSGNAFEIMDEFVKDSNKRLEHLSLIIKAMSEEDISIEEIENDILGIEYIKVIQMTDIILKILGKEFISEVKESSEDTKN